MSWNPLKELEFNSRIYKKSPTLGYQPTLLYDKFAALIHFKQPSNLYLTIAVSTQYNNISFILPYVTLTKSTHQFANTNTTAQDLLRWLIRQHFSRHNQLHWHLDLSRLDRTYPRGQFGSISIPYQHQVRNQNIKIFSYLAAGFPPLSCWMPKALTSYSTTFLQKKTAFSTLRQ